MQRGDDKKPQDKKGGWAFYTTWPRLSDGMGSGCNECSVYCDAVDTYFHNKCSCFMEGDLSVDIKVFHFTQYDRLSCDLKLDLYDWEIHAPQDHQTHIRSRKGVHPFGKMTLKLIQATGMFM